jgi:hypothetical protein
MKVPPWLWLGCCLLCQCAGTETGNPVLREDALFGFAPVSATVARGGLGDVSFDRVAIRLASMSLEPCAGGDATVLFQERSVDLFAADVEELRIPAGSYCALLLEMGSGADSFSAGRMVSQGKTTLTFESQLRASVRLALNGPLVTTGARPDWVLAVDLSQWLDAIDRWLNGRDLQFSPNDAETLALRNAQARSLRLYEDVDGNGGVDQADLDAPLSGVGVLRR